MRMGRTDYMPSDSAPQSGSPEPEPPLRPPVKLYEPDRVAGMRQSTARLFGAFVWRERQRNRLLSAEVFLDGVGRTEAWLGAVERGEVIPTDKMVKKIEGAFLNNDHDLDLEETIGLLELRPYGSIAGELRADLGIEIEHDRLPTSGVTLDGPVPVITAVRQQDRFLILAPILMTTGLLLSGFTLVDWSQGAKVEFDLSIPIITSGAAVALAAFFLNPLDRFLRWIAHGTRPRAAVIDLELYHLVRYRNGLATEDHGARERISGSDAGDAAGDEGGSDAGDAADEFDHKKVDWFTPGDQSHLLAGTRDAAWSNGLLADFSERLAPLVAAVAAVAAIVTVAALFQGAPDWTELSLIAFTLLMTAAAVAIRCSATRAGARALSAVARGCGYSLEDAENLRAGYLPPLDC